MVELCYFCRLEYANCLKMKKIAFIALAVVALCLGGCKDNVTTQYTIGCLEYQNASAQETDFQAIVDYFQTHVDYNNRVSFEGVSLAENDAQARKYFDEQMAKIDTAYVCSLFSGSDYLVYGIATMNASGTYRYVKAAKFMMGGVSDVSE